MKEVTIKFFGSIVNKLEESKFINSLFQEKIKGWKGPKDLDYSRYSNDNGLNYNNVTDDFKFAVDMMESLKLSQEVDNALEK